MNDIRRTILWVIFGFSLVLLWDQWQIHNGRPATFFPSPAGQSATVKDPQVASAAAVGDVPAPVAMQSAANGSSDPIQAAAVQPAIARERVVVNTDVLKLTFDTEGGSLVQAEFLQHRDLEDEARNFVLLDESAERVYVSQTGLIGNGAGTGFPTHKTMMKLVTPERELRAGSDELQVKFESPETGGVKLVKTYTLKRGSYTLDVRHEVHNAGGAPVSPQL